MCVCMHTQARTPSCPCQAPCYPCVFHYRRTDLEPALLFPVICCLEGSREMKRAGQPALQAMLTPSERSCRVSWQLTQWIWILWHKVGSFPLCLGFPGNVPPSCFHIDLITQPWWWAWHRQAAAWGLFAPVDLPFSQGQCGRMWVLLRQSDPPPFPEDTSSKSLKKKTHRSWGVQLGGEWTRNHFFFLFKKVQGRKRRRGDARAAVTAPQCMDRRTQSRVIQSVLRVTTFFPVETLINYEKLSFLNPRAS